MSFSSSSGGWSSFAAATDGTGMEGGAVAFALAAPAAGRRAALALPEGWASATVRGALARRAAGRAVGQPDGGRSRDVVAIFYCRSVKRVAACGGSVAAVHILSPVC